MKFFFFFRPPHLLAQRRIDCLKKYTQLAQQGKPEGLKLGLRMQAYLRPTLVGNAWCYLDRCYRTFFLVSGQTPGEDMASGFKLGGWMPDSELLPRLVEDPTLTQDALRQSTSSFHSKYLSRCISDKRPTPTGP